jgi:predicted AAA+ superfamily ATPase
VNDSERTDFDRFKSLILNDYFSSGLSFLLLGARQTGKSTLIGKLFEQLPATRKLAYPLQNPAVRQRLELNPESLIQEVDALYGQAKEKIYVYVDEIQKVPALMDPLQFVIDEKKVILAACGSSARKMKSLGTNWLPGRILLEHLGPLTCTELGQRYNQSEYLRFGGLPDIALTSNPELKSTKLASYTHLYLEEEIRAEAAVRSLPLFTKFLQLAALESGTAPNFSKIGSQVGTSHTSIRSYYKILCDSLIAHEIPSFGDSRNSILRQSKYYFFDVGVRNAAAKVGFHESLLTLQSGILNEHSFLQQKLVSLPLGAKVSYWTSKNKLEVDFVIESHGQLHAYEVKATSQPDQKDFKGLTAFKQHYPAAQLHLICNVPRPALFNGVLVQSIESNIGV